MTERTVQRAWYRASIPDFVRTDDRRILAQLVDSSEFDIRLDQRSAWEHEISLLRQQLDGLSGSLLLEFTIPRMGHRVDAVLLIGEIVFVIEFKVGAKQVDRSAFEQVWDYALDLKNFHKASHERPIVPIAIATARIEAPTLNLDFDVDDVYRPVTCGGTDLRAIIAAVLAKRGGSTIDAESWYEAPYHPTPTIVEAARALYSQHSVDAIARSDAGAVNLRVTSARLEELIAEARSSKQKVICFVTGVPGAGKTLVGLNLATRRNDETPGARAAVYLSGNDPLVAVLREALTRDEVARRRQQRTTVRTGQVRGIVKQFIQNVHHFRDAALAEKNNPPFEHIAIFDEAQRAWTEHETSSFMQRKKKIAGFNQSEPEFLIRYLDRHSDWSAIVCLVGGGQEINRGEAGIDEWLHAINTRFPHWKMYISSKLTDTEYAAGHALDLVRNRQLTSFDDSLHLSVSMRSFRADNVSAFVKALLDREKSEARASLDRLSARYPIVVTRDLNAAKAWVRAKARGSERFGLLASSRAMRLKPHAVDVRVKANPVHWFLNNKDDVRSSFYLEDAATEFQVQGLEVDWACVTWDADLRVGATDWSYHDFKGCRWQNVKNSDYRRYLLNSYRVLLTRARQGMVIFVPPGDRHDRTRPPDYYDATYKYLTTVGVPELP